jgi:hypothetical protein
VLITATRSEVSKAVLAVISSADVSRLLGTAHDHSTVSVKKASIYRVSQNDVSDLNSFFLKTYQQ